VRVLIIGGTGTISAPITQQLAARGEEVTLYNRGLRAAESPAGVQHLRGDRRDYAAFEARMAEAGRFQCVIDMVGFAPEDMESAVRAFRGRTEHFVFCSTVDVYQKPAPCYPYRESDAPRVTVGEYGLGKARCEGVLMAAHARGDFAVTCLRPAYTYREGGGLVHSFGWSTTYLDRLRRGKPIVVHGDGTSVWTACHATDVARTFANAAGNPRVYGRSYHVAGEEWITWNRYHEIVAEALGVTVRLVHIPSDLLARVAPERASWLAWNFQYHSMYDTRAARQDLGFCYTVPFSEGARRVVSWLLEHGQIEDSEGDPFEDRLIARWEEAGTRMAADVGAE
jgi:nucleoside-diphosphate-sugar epimerase